MRFLRALWRRYVGGGGRVSSTGPAGPDHRPGGLIKSGDVAYIGGPHRSGPGRPPPQDPIPGRIDWQEIEDLIREIKASEPPHVPRPPGWGERLGPGWNWNPPMHGRDRP